MRTPTRIDLTTGSVHRHLIRMALPMIFGLTASMSFSFVDLYFIGTLGDDSLAAMGFVARVIMIIFSATIGLSAGISSVLARAAGSNNQEEVKKIATNTFILTLLLSVFFTVSGLLTIDPLFILMGADEDILPLIREYMTIWYFSPLFMMLPMTGGAVMRALGDTKYQGKIMIFAAIGNAILDPLLIFGHFGFPELGIAGAAWASLIIQFITFVTIFYALYCRYHVICFKKETVGDFFNSVKKIMHVGIPATGTNMIIPIVSAIIISIIADYGNEAVAATNVATTIEFLALVPFFALSAVIGPFIGQNLGAGNYERIDECIKKSTMFCLAWGALLAFLLMFFAVPIATMFSTDQDIVKITALYLCYVPASYGLYGLVMSVNAIFNSIGQPFPGVVISTMRVFVLQLPLVFIASMHYDLDIVFMLISLSNMIAGIIGYIWIMKTTAALKPFPTDAALTD
ncbi:MAG: MATE family efflux transporter [Emcibacteraceae bacterium]|nr:MATE family efflux transporter [Emcibacteraceae bacterium]